MEAVLKQEEAQLGLGYQFGVHKVSLYINNAFKEPLC